MSLFPIFLKLGGRRCLVVGAGTVAAPKIRSLLNSSGEVRVIAPWANPEVKEWSEKGMIKWEQRAFEVRDFDEQFLVIAATSSPEVNSLIFREAQRRRILCNSVDDPENCDFFYPAVVRRGDFQLAISTAGHSPALAQRLRKEFEIQFGLEYEAWVEDLGKGRKQLFQQEMDPETRRQLLHRLASREAFESARSTPASAGGTK